jgi:hypothetical protein
MADKHCLNKNSIRISNPAKIFLHPRIPIEFLCPQAHLLPAFVQEMTMQRFEKANDHGPRMRRALAVDLPETATQVLDTARAALAQMRAEFAPDCRTTQFL